MYISKVETHRSLNTIYYTHKLFASVRVANSRSPKQKCILNLGAQVVIPQRTLERACQPGRGNLLRLSSLFKARPEVETEAQPFNRAIQ
jgi:hypothetical protein